MKVFSKFLLKIYTSTLILLGSAKPVWAQSLIERMRSNINSMRLEVASGDTEKITGVIIKSFLSILGIIFFILIIYAGFLWMTAAGNEEKITKAKKILISSAIGITIIFASYAITTIIFILLEEEVIKWLKFSKNSLLFVF